MEILHRVSGVTIALSLEKGGHDVTSYEQLVNCDDKGKNHGCKLQELLHGLSHDRHIGFST